MGTYTNRELFLMMPPHIQERWLNIHSIIKINDSFVQEDFFHFILHSFVWCRTDEGHNYWFNVANRCFPNKDQNYSFGKVINLKHEFI